MISITDQMVHIPDLDEQTRTVLRRTAGRLRARVDTVAAATADQIAADVAEVAALNLHSVVVETCRANLSALLDTLETGAALDQLAIPAEVLIATRELVHRGMSLEAMLKAYRSGTRFLNREWAQTAIEAPADDAAQIVAIGSDVLLAWLERTSEELAQEYRGEFERLATSRSMLQLAEMHCALDPENDADDISTSTLGYVLTPVHTAIAVRAVHSDSAGGLEEAVGILVDSSTRRLCVRVDPVTMWCWYPSAAPPALGDDQLPEGIVAGVGTPYAGLDGFRRSHREAALALDVAIAAEADRRLNRYPDIEIAALCLGHLPLAANLIHRELGPLAADTDSAAQLRTTLASYFATGRNFRETAKVLQLHHNSVRYRIAKIQDLLGVEFTADNQLAPKLALYLTERLSPWALSR